MKKFVSVLTAVVLATSFTACNKNKEAIPSSQTKSGKVVTIMIGYENNPGEPVDLACHKWKDLVEQKSNGTMQISLYPSSQLGSKDNIIDQAVNGDNVITLANGAFFQDRGVKDFGIVFAPYLFSSWDDFAKLTASDWWKQKSEELENKCSLKILTSWRYGVRHTLTKTPVRTPSDLKGMKIRVPNNIIQIKSFAALGATATAMPLGEVYTALQQGVIDGLENPLPVILNGAYQEVAKYLILDGHVYDYTSWVTGTKFFNSLTQEQQQILTQCGDEAGVYNNERLEEVTNDALQKLKADGVTVIDIDKNEFRKIAESLYSDPDIKKMWSAGLEDRIRTIIQE